MTRPFRISYSSFFAVHFSWHCLHFRSEWQICSVAFGK